MDLRPAVKGHFSFCPIDHTRSASYALRLYFFGSKSTTATPVAGFSVDIIIAWATNTGIKLLIALILLFVSFKLIGRAAKLITKQCGGAWHFVSSAPDPTREYKKQTGMLLPIKK